MSGHKYFWRQLTPEQRASLLAWRNDRHWPWHSPPHSPGSHTHYHITAACFEHRHYIGQNAQRMQAFSEALLGVFSKHSERCLAWCVLPNHYHALVHTSDLAALFAELGRLHGRTSFEWNGQEGARGRQIWFRATDRWMRTDSHLWTTFITTLFGTATSDAGWTGHFPALQTSCARWDTRKPCACGTSIRC